MKSSAKKVELASVDDLFSTEESRADAQRERVLEIPLSELHPFKNHPFKVKDDEAMMETADSVRQYGVLVPAIARPDPEGGYELVRRCMTLFTAIKKWLHQLFGKTEEKAVQPVKTKKKLSRADKKQIEAAIARANRTDKKEKSAQDSIPYERMWPDGICRVSDGHYTKTIQFQDINYQLSQNEDKTAIFEGWCDFLNYFDSSIQFELSFLNLAASEETFARAINIPLQRDDFDSIRVEYTTMLQNQLAKGNNGLIKTKYRKTVLPMFPSAALFPAHMIICLHAMLGKGQKHAGAKR